MIRKNFLCVFVLMLAFVLPSFAWTSLDNPPGDKGKRVLDYSAYLRRKRSAGKVSQVAEFGGINNRPNGIEGRRLTFGFQVGGTVPLMESAKNEATTFGGKFNFFIYGLIPKTKTFAIGAELGGTLLSVSQRKYIDNLSASTRARTTEADIAPEVSVGNWLVATPQVSFMGNFHPQQRFNIQLKGNIGVALAMVPQTTAKYYIKDIQDDGTYKSTLYTYSYRSGMKLGFCGAIGTDLLYALSKHAELKGGIDLTYMRFVYAKEWSLPTERVTKVVSQFALLDIHIGFAFNF